MQSAVRLRSGPARAWPGTSRYGVRITWSGDSRRRSSWKILRQSTRPPVEESGSARFRRCRRMTLQRRPGRDQNGECRSDARSVGPQNAFSRQRVDQRRRLRVSRLSLISEPVEIGNSTAKRRSSCLWTIAIARVSCWMKNAVGEAGRASCGQAAQVSVPPCRNPASAE